MSGNGDLNMRILAGHASGDFAGLSDLYAEAGLNAEANGEIDRACFFFTQAYVFALDAGSTAAAADLRAKLVSYGREL